MRFLLLAYQLSIAAIFQNEAPYLKEWIDYHRLVGVEHFYLYNNLSADNWEAVLAPYVNRGVVEVFEWPYASSNAVEWKPIQRKCYNDALMRAKKKTKWLAFIDTDEFICPLMAPDVPKFLSRYEKEAGVVVWWQCFGTSGVKKIRPGELMIEKLTACAFKDDPVNGWFKTICRPERVVRVANAHQVVARPPYKIIDEGKERAQLNHYWTRDLWFMKHEKIPRHLRWGGLPNKVEEREKEMSLTHDFAIQPFVKKLKAKSRRPGV